MKASRRGIINPTYVVHQNQYYLMKKLAPLSSLPAVYVLVAVILIITIPSVVVRGSEVRAQGRQLMMLKMHRVLCVLIQMQLWLCLAWTEAVRAQHRCHRALGHR
ncbi:unnamed protein product [Urochloa humidicola]